LSPTITQSINMGPDNQLVSWLQHVGNVSKVSHGSDIWSVRRENVGMCRQATTSHHALGIATNLELANFLRPFHGFTRCVAATALYRPSLQL